MRCYFTAMIWYHYSKYTPPLSMLAILESSNLRDSNMQAFYSHNNDRKRVEYNARTIASNSLSRLHIHSGNSWTKYNATYHRGLCNGGCGEFVLAQHYARTPGSNATCLGCGYVGNISIGLMSMEDRSANDIRHSVIVRTAGSSFENIFVNSHNSKHYNYPLSKYFETYSYIRVIHYRPAFFAN